MARYDILEAGFSNLDETINFGTRAVGDNTNLYEIVTAAVIRSSEAKTSDAVKIISKYQHESIFFSIDKTLRILKDKNITDQIGCFEFDDIIDTFCISPCGRFILIGTQDEKITIRTLSFNVSNDNGNEDGKKIPIVFEENLENCSTVRGSFKGSFFHDNSFYMLTIRGLVKKIVLDTDNIESPSFKSEILFHFEPGVNICSFGYPFLCVEGSKLQILNVNTGICENHDAIGLKKLDAIQSYFLGYATTGSIYRIYPSELIVFCVNKNYPDLVDNFENLMFIDDGEQKSLLHILGITKCRQASNKKEIQLITYPGSDLVYSLPLEGRIHLMDMKDLSDDVLFFTEIRKNLILTEIRLQIIIKADPEFRLKKLIQKQLFDEAEIFAKTFNVSSEIIAKAKAQNIANKMICTTQDIDQLLAILDTIDNPLIKLNYCDNVDCESGIDTRRVLGYGAFIDITVKDCNQNRDTILLVKKMDFNDRLHRFDTFMQIYETYDHSKWKYFVNCDIINEIKTLLQKGEIEKASVIFSRLDRTTVHDLTAEKIEEIIVMLNKEFLTKITFLSTFVPISLKYVPDSFVIFVRWLHDRVLQLEKQCGEFPESAITFVREIAKLMDLTTPVKKHLHIEDLQKLTCLLKALEDLKMLLNNFGVIFPLSDYLTNPFTVIRTLLNANSDAASFEALMTNFVCPFIFKNGLDMDNLLIEEIENLLVYEEEYWVTIVPVLLKFIASVDRKLELAYKILEVTDIPWSDSVKNIAHTTYQLAPKDPLAEKIVEHLKNEGILIILRKYNILKSHFENLDDKIFYFNRMIYLNRASVFEDIHALCLDDKVRHEADLLIINSLIKKQDYDQAMAILDQNKPDKIVALGKQILHRCFQFATSYNLPKKYRDPYFVVLNLIWNRLKRHAESPHDRRCFEFDFKIAYAIFGISEFFNLKVTSTDLLRKRDGFLNSLVDKIAEEYLEEDNFNFEAFTLKCKKLAKFFEVDLETIFTKCLVNSKNLNPFLDLGQYILDTSTVSNVLAYWAIFLVKYLKTNFVDDCDETLSDVFLNVSKNHEDYLEGIQLAKKLSIKAVINATPEDHPAIMEVMRWVDSCFYLTNVSKPLNMDTLQIYNSNNALSQSVQSVEAIKSVFNIYCGLLGSFPRPDMNQLTCFTSNLNINKDQFDKELEGLSGNINILLKEGQHLTCFNVIKTIQEGLLTKSNLSKDTLMELQQLIEVNWLPKALEAVLSYRYIDKTLLLNLMLLCNTSGKQLWTYLQTYKRQPNKLIVITQVGLELCKHQKNTQGEMDLLKNLNLCKWWNKITDKNINYEFFFTAKSEDRLEALILAKQVNLDNLPKYCVDFHLDLQETYLKFLEMTLKFWQPEYKKITNIHGKTNIMIKCTESGLDKECQNIIKCISNKEKVILLVDELWPKVNFYHYEVFMVLLSIYSKLSLTKNTRLEAYQPLLLFLKSYVRVTGPFRSEIEAWFGTFPLHAFIDPLSEFRLPLSSTFFSSSIWDIIKPEVNLETYKEWFKIVPILKQFLNANDICTYAINSALPTIMNEPDICTFATASALPARLGGSTSDTWELYPKYDHVIAKVEECAKFISNVELATAAVYNLMCNMSPGADKVRMAELSYKYAEMYKESPNSGELEKVYIKIKQRYFNYSAIYILHKYELAEDEYLKLVAQPSDLILKLYDDPRIPKQICTLYFDCPDINHAVEELCKLFGMTAKKIKFGALFNFLKADSTLDLDKDEESDCLLRAYYICGSTDFHKNLLKIGMNRDDIESNMSVRANALKCLYYTNDVDSLEAMSDMDHETFLIYMNKISVMAKLEDLGLKLKSVEELDQFSKKKLLRKLAEIDKAISIKCIANVCKIYELDDLTYWKFIVNSAIRFNMIKDLCDYVEYLRFRCVKDFVIDAWKVILTDAFKAESNYVPAMRLLQTCPVIYALNFEDYIEKCLINKRPEIAAMLLQYMPSEKHETIVKNILSKDGIFEDVAALKDNGILGTDIVIKILVSFS